MSTYPFKMLTVPEAAAVLGLSERTLRSWLEAQRIPFTQLERSCRRYIYSKDLHAFSEKNGWPLDWDSLF